MERIRVVREHVERDDSIEMTLGARFWPKPDRHVKSTLARHLHQIGCWLDPTCRYANTGQRL